MSIPNNLLAEWSDLAETEPGFAIALALADLAQAQYATARNVAVHTSAVVRHGEKVAGLGEGLGAIATEVSLALADRK